MRKWTLQRLSTIFGNTCAQLLAHASSNDELARSARTRFRHRCDQRAAALTAMAIKRHWHTVIIEMRMPFGNRVQPMEWQRTHHGVPHPSDADAAEDHVLRASLYFAAARGGVADTDDFSHGRYLQKNNKLTIFWLSAAYLPFSFQSGKCPTCVSAQRFLFILYFHLDHLIKWTSNLMTHLQLSQFKSPEFIQPD